LSWTTPGVLEQCREQMGTLKKKNKNCWQIISQKACNEKNATKIQRKISPQDTYPTALLLKMFQGCLNVL
jgi:hypothetical protein